MQGARFPHKARRHIQATQELEGHVLDPKQRHLETLERNLGEVEVGCSPQGFSAHQKAHVEAEPDYAISYAERRYRGVMRHSLLASVVPHQRGPHLSIP